ncbi:hypothetical protein HYD_3690 [Candidatus Hydrogenosomobacter endosymbioticus]|uniref:Uncharacterized protein n=1 Tax=Candidatus Hydrogenosomobacter endosymbioticus TaxID=2558174 RepID=A0ABN6L302_9PROT|nr:hypothetical protein HYD_3690 [Candidatus Hydrogenosomobacter endosymbioticus]
MNKYLLTVLAVIFGFGGVSFAEGEPTANNAGPSQCDAALTSCKQNCSKNQTGCLNGCASTLTNCGTSCKDNLNQCLQQSGQVPAN